MAFQFNPASGPPDEIRRVSTEWILDSVKCLDGYPEEDPEGLHDTRRNIKRLRALLRLVGTGKARAQRKSVNLELRDIGRQLAGFRDSEVLGMMLPPWMAREEVSNNPHLMGSLRKLQQYFDHSCGGPDIGKNLPKIRTRERLLEVQASIAAICMEDLDWVQVLEAAQRCVRRLDMAYGSYLARPGDSTLHEWRKRLKDHLYQLMLLTGITAVPQDALDNVKGLEKFLGLARDQDLLLETLGERSDTGLAVDEMNSVMFHARQERERLLAEALVLAGRVSVRIRNHPLDKKE